MINRSIFRTLTIAAGLIVVFALSGDVLGQGRGRGNSGNKGNGRDNSSNVDRGNSDKKSSDDSLWSGFPDDKNRNRNSNRNDSNKGSQRFRGLSKSTGLSQSYLEKRYSFERSLNPNLTYGQFVAAHMITKKNKNISSEEILRGLRNGRSIGQTLHDRKWDRRKIDKERRRIWDIFRGDRDYRDRDLDWLF